VSPRIILSFKDSMTFQRRREHGKSALCFAIVSLLSLSAALIWPTVAWTSADKEQSRPVGLLSLGSSWLPKPLLTMFSSSTNKENMGTESKAGSGSGNDYFEKTLQALRHDLISKVGQSRKLGQALKEVMQPDQFAPEEPWKHAHRTNDFFQYGDFYNGHAQPVLAMRFPGDDDQHYRNNLPSSTDYEAPPYTGMWDDTGRVDTLEKSAKKLNLCKHHSYSTEFWRDDLRVLPFCS
jgi:hypothetical protein